MTEALIRDHMSQSPHTIPLGTHLAAAWALMQQHRIRHLPVVENGRVVGLVSDRDLQLLNALHGVDPDDIMVAELMRGAPYVVSPDAPLHQVAHEMAHRRIGSAVVVDGDDVVGIFTTTDALLALEAATGAPA